MDDERLAVAVIGLGVFGRQTLRALVQGRRTRVVGVADKDPSVAEEAGRELGIPHFSDNRSLLAQSRPAAVFLAVPPMHGPELIETCARRGIHVWKEAPLARTAEEAAAMVRRMEQAKLKFAVGTQRRFAAGYRRAKKQMPRLAPVYLARSHYLFNWGPRLGWRGDRASAGGGALLELGYHCVDLLNWLLGLPEEVYGLSIGGKRVAETGPDGEPLPVYDTDDTAAAVCRWSTGAMATVVTTRTSGPVSEKLHVHGRGGSLAADGESCLLRDSDGNVLDRMEDEPRPLAVFGRQAEAFAQAVIEDAATYECSARENLLNQAVIDAIYLSNRTASPESPRRLLRNCGLEVEDCLRQVPEDADSPGRAPQTDPQEHMETGDALNH